MKRLNVALLGGAAALSVLLPSSARAAALIIDDTLPSEQIVISANDFEQGLSINGAPFQSGRNNLATGTFPEGDATGGPIVYNFDGFWITNGAALPPPVQVEFIEPGTTLVSDILFATYTAGGNVSRVQGYFVSDTTELGLNPALYLTAGVPVTTWPETNGAFDFSAPFLQASATSDVPEPTSCGLVALAAGALVRRRRPA